MRPGLKELAMIATLIGVGKACNPDISQPSQIIEVQSVSIQIQEIPPSGPIKPELKSAVSISESLDNGVNVGIIVIAGDLAINPINKKSESSTPNNDLTRDIPEEQKNELKKIKINKKLSGLRN